MRSDCLFEPPVFRCARKGSQWELNGHVLYTLQWRFEVERFRRMELEIQPFKAVHGTVMYPPKPCGAAQFKPFSP